MRKAIVRVIPVICAVVVASCGTQGYAAKINSTTISVSGITNELASVTHNPSFVQVLKGGHSPVYGTGQGTYSTVFVDNILNRRITVTEIEQVESRLNIKPTSIEASLAGALTVQSVGSSQVFAGFSRSYQHQLVSDTTAIVAMESYLTHQPLTQARVGSYYHAHASQFTSICASQILEATPAQDQAVLAKLKAGQSFASVAKADSKDPNTASNGGAVGCGTVPNYVQSFGPAFGNAVASLPLDSPSQPVQISQGWAVVEVTSRTVPSLSQATLEVANAMIGANGQTALDTFLASLARHQVLRVNPAYGRVVRTKSFVGIESPTGFSKSTLKGYFVPIRP
ncbi:MAG: peptidylprolyl isomerase [Ferrimicrobium sp.]